MIHIYMYTLTHSEHMTQKYAMEIVHAKGTFVIHPLGPVRVWPLCPVVCTLVTGICCV
jgi:hypothetical protein